MIAPVLIHLVVSLIILGVILWAITQIPMDPAISNIIRVLVIVAVVIYLLSLLVPGFAI